MNTVNSVYYGWAFFIACGAGSYYYAKRSINADRAQRQQLERERQIERNKLLAGASQNVTRRREQAEREALSSIGGASDGRPVTGDGSGGQEGPGLKKKSKFEASEPYRSPKGDRFSGL